MNKKYCLLTLALVSLISISCKKVEKDVLSYYPKVKTVSAVPQPDGSVIVTGEIEDEGTTAIEYKGFCMDTVPEPEMLSNQQIVYMDGNMFTAVYPEFDLTKTYYFRSWAANEYGYTLGNILSLDSIEPVPVVSPCTPPGNSVNMGGFQPTQYFYDVPYPVEGFNKWEIHASTGSGLYHFIFPSLPVTKEYTTTSWDTPAPNTVRISFTSGFTTGLISDGAKLYVNQTSPGHWTMTLCNGPWISGSSTTFYMNLNMVCPL